MFVLGERIIKHQATPTTFPVSSRYNQLCRTFRFDATAIKTTPRLASPRLAPPRLASPRPGRSAVIVFKALTSVFLVLVLFHTGHVTLTSGLFLDELTQLTAPVQASTGPTDAVRAPWTTAGGSGPGHQHVGASALPSGGQTEVNGPLTFQVRGHTNSTAQVRGHP